MARSYYDALALDGRRDSDLSDESGDSDQSVQDGWAARVAEYCERQEVKDVIESAVAGVILLNTIVIGLEVDDAKAWYWFYFDNGFLLFFFLEISCRLYAAGCTNFFCGSPPRDEPDGPRDRSDVGWNTFDFSVVLFGVLDQWVVALLRPDHDHGKLSRVFMTFRMIRILRVLRMFRLFKAFPELYLLASGLLQSIQTVVWLFVLFALILWLVSIICVNLLRDGDEMTQKYFGTIWSCMFTLFQFVTLDDWSRIARHVAFEEDRYYMMFVFVVYVMFTAFVVLSLLTGVISEHMIAVTKQNELSEQMREQKAVEWLKGFVQRKFRGDGEDEPWDVDGSGTISAEELKALLQNPKVQEEMNRNQGPDLARDGMAKLMIEDLFNTLDQSGDMEISMEELIDGFQNMRGDAKSVQMLELKAEMNRLRNDLGFGGGGENQTQLAGLHQKLSATIALLSDVKARLRHMEHHVQHLSHRERRAGSVAPTSPH